MDNTQLLEVAVTAARRAGMRLLEGLGQPLEVGQKAARDYVTPLDVEAEWLILNTVRSVFPEHSALGEETGESAGSAEYRWIIDPISSTRNYVHGLPHWAVCIAVEKLGVPLVAVALDPFYDELFTAQAGAGTFLNGKRVQVSEVANLHKAMMCATFNVEGETAAQSIDHGLGYYSRLIRVGDLRSFGSAGLHMGFVAAGRFEAFVSNSADIYTTVAGALLVREAGGVVTDFAGNDWTANAEGLVASNGRFHADLLRVVRGD